MCNLSEKNIADRSFFQMWFYSLNSNFIKSCRGGDNQKFFDLPREDSATSLKDSYLESNFIVT